MLPRTLMLVIGLTMLAFAVFAHDASGQSWAEVDFASQSTLSVDRSFEAASIQQPLYQPAMIGCAVDCPDGALVSPVSGLLGAISRARTAWFPKASSGTVAPSVAPAVPPPRI